MQSIKTINEKYQSWIVWALRIVVGAVFVISGLSKSIDIWGFVFKIQEYLMVWNYPVPHSLVVIVALLLSVGEFMLGAMLLVGAYRRTSVWLMIAMMCGMLPLTLYIFIKNPVADCGCFGDFWVLSNGATFLKNIFITLALIYLAVNNPKVNGLYHPYLQWIVASSCLIYIVAVSLFGYNIQPLVDFRSFPVGANIISEDEEDVDVDNYLFVYEKDGQRQSFTASQLPDSTWTFVDRVVGDNQSDSHSATELSALDDDNEDVTYDVISTSGPQLIIVLPDYSKASPAYTYAINELQQLVASQGGSLVELAAVPSDRVEQWRDMSMATYPIYRAESTALKELARGSMAAVYTIDGKIVWKRSLASIDLTQLSTLPIEKRLSSLAFNGPRLLLYASIILLVWLILVMGIEKSRYVVKWIEKRQKSKKISNFATQNKTDKNSINNTTNMRKNIVAGNWKMNTTLQEGLKLAKDVNNALAGVDAKCDVIIAVPFTHLASINEVIDKNKLGLGAENCADHRSGAYTGEVSAPMVASTGATYVILGHSERRQYYGETSETLKEKVALALENGLTPIFCIGEVLEERENGTYLDVVKTQIEDALFNLSAEDFSKLILAYEPVWAIGTGKTATDDQAEEMHAFIRGVIAEKYGKEVADNTSILYGGSCKPSNAKALFAKPNVDGGLIGGASLDAESFMGIVTAFE